MVYVADNFDALIASTGKPPHPGPPEDLDFKFVLSTQNVHSLTTYLEPLTKFDFDICFAQETSIPKYNYKNVHDLLSKFHLKGLLTPTDPEFSSAVGGLATLSKQSIKLVKILPITDQYKSIMHNGRVQMTGIVLPSNVVLIVVNLYCWTNGHVSEKASQ
eukprot:10487709-Karenia_brevis.AAC.1